MTFYLSLCLLCLACRIVLRLDKISHAKSYLEKQSFVYIVSFSNTISDQVYYSGTWK